MQIVRNFWQVWEEGLPLSLLYGPKSTLHFN